MENIKNAWFMDKNAWNEDIYSKMTIVEIEEDGETFFDVVDKDGDQMDTFTNLDDAFNYVNDVWECEQNKMEDEEFDRLTAIPDSVASLGLTGMFGV